MSEVLKEEIVIKIGLYDLVTSTTLESNKSHFPVSAITDRLYARHQFALKHLPCHLRQAQAKKPHELLVV